MTMHTRLTFALTSALLLVAGPLACTLDDKNLGEDGAETNGDDADTDTTAGGACELEFEGPQVGTSGEFLIRNDRDVPIYIPESISTCTFEALQIWEGETRLYWDDDAAIPTCTELVANGCNWGCSDGPSSAIKLDPGETWTETWGYYVWEPAELTEACVEGSDCEAGYSCRVGRTRLEGTLSAHLRVTESCPFGDLCDCGGPACLIEIDSLSIEAVETETVELDFDAGGEQIVLAIQ